jgi:hypothetical protein
MATQTRSPTSDISATGSWTGTAGTRWALVDDHPDAAGTDVITQFTAAGGNILFGFSAFTVPAGSTINSVSVVYYDRRNAGGTANAQGYISIGGPAVYTMGTSHNAAASLTLRTDTRTVHPETGLAWTVDQVNGVAADGLTAFGIISTDSNPTISISSVQLVVDYTAPIFTGTISSTLAGVEDADLTGIVRNPGTISSTLAGVTSSASLTVGGFFGTFASTLAGVSGNFTGSTPSAGWRSFLFMEAGGAGHSAANPGTFSSTLAGVTASWSGTVTNVGTFTPTLAGVFANFDGGGAGNASFRSFLWLEGGGASDLPTVPQGTIAVTLDNVTSSATIVVNNRGTFASTLAGFTANFSGAHQIATGGFLSFLGIEFGGAGIAPSMPYRLQPYDDGLPKAWYADPGYGSYYVYNPDGIYPQNRDQVGNVITGEIALTLNNLTSDIFGEVSQDVDGDLASTLDGVTAVITGSSGFPEGDLEATLNNDVLDISGFVTVGGPLETTLENITSAVSGLTDNRGTIAATVSGDIMDFSGVMAVHVTGTFGSTLEGVQGADFFTYRNRHISIGINRLSI